MWIMVDSAGLYTVTLATTVVSVITNINALAIMIEVVCHHFLSEFSLSLIIVNTVADADHPHNIYRILWGFDSSRDGSSG